VLLAALLGLLLVLWSWVDAQARAVVVISAVLDVPVLTPAAEAVSGEPRFSEQTVAGNPALVARPAGEGPWPAVFFVKRPEVGGRVSLIAGVAPYSDVRTILNVATTGRYERADGSFARHDADPFLSYVVARSMIAALPPGDDRRDLSAEMEAIGRESPNPLGGLRLRRTEDLGPEARKVVELLANRDPARFDGLYSGLPDGVREDLEAFSPLDGEGRVRAPVEVATGPKDKYFPASESHNLEGIAPDLRVTVTPAIDHAELEISPQDATAFAGFDAFVVRALRGARLEGD